MKVKECHFSGAFGPKVHALLAGLRMNYGKSQANSVKLAAQRKGSRHTTLQRARNNAPTRVSFATTRVSLTQVNYKAIDK